MCLPAALRLQTLSVSVPCFSFHFLFSELGSIPASSFIFLPAILLLFSASRSIFLLVSSFRNNFLLWRRNLALKVQLWKLLQQILDIFQCSICNSSPFNKPLFFLFFIFTDGLDLQYLFWLNHLLLLLINHVRQIFNISLSPKFMFFEQDYTKYMIHPCSCWQFEFLSYCTDLLVNFLRSIEFQG